MIRRSALLAAALLVLAPGCSSSDGGDGGDPTPIVGDDGASFVGGDTSGGPSASDAGPTGGSDAAGGGLDSFVPTLPPGDTYTGPPTGELGDQPFAGVCSADDGCDTGSCNALHPGGYCTVWCSSNADCPDGGMCFNDTVGGGKKMCWKSCETNADCRIDQFCTGGPFGVCTPKCVPGKCPDPSYECVLATGICEPPGRVTCDPDPEVCDAVDNDCDDRVDEGCGPAVGQAEHIVLEDFGAVQIGGGGLSRNLFFDVSSAAVSFTIVVIATEDSEDAMGLFELEDSAGELIVTGMDPMAAPIRAYPDIGVVTVQVTNTPSYTSLPGVHRFSIMADGPARYAWVYVLQSVREEVAPARLDLNVWFVGTPGLNASTAKTNNKFQWLMDTLSNTLANHSVLLGDVKYYDVSGADAQKYTYVDVDHDAWSVDEHAELIALSAQLPPSNKGLNVFFVQAFSGWGLLGKAGGIPGPPLAHGTWRSGVVVSLIDYYEYQGQIGVPLTAEATAHEVGHQLGLFHTTEQTGDFFDPIQDTPQCPKTHDYNNDGVVDPQECEGLGGDNLMFWAASFQTGLSSGQKFVVHRNASMY
jgi:hypothetical protein